MKMKKCVLAIGICLAITVGVVEAEQNNGIPIYPGAKYLSELSEFNQKLTTLKYAHYETGDSLNNVIGYYKGQPDILFFGSDEKSAVFRKGETALTLQTPWMDQMTGEMMKSTLISMTTP